MKSLLFIYNANSGLGNTILDIGHKLFSPSTYPCHLCDITYGIFTENERWKKFRETTALDLQFYHIDEFERVFPKQSFQYPIILTSEKGQLKSFLSCKEINQLKDSEALIKRIETQLSEEKVDDL